MKGLKANTERFCRDPVNVMTEKHFLVKKLLQRPGDRSARACSRPLRKDLDSWLKIALTPISNQLKEHQTLLERRVENLKKLSGDLSSLQERLHQLETQKMALGKQVEDLAAHQVQSAGHRGAPARGARQGGLSPLNRNAAA